MEVRCSTLLAVTSLLYLTLTVSTVSGKCSGRWAIHACFGGNGKRSDPSLSENNGLTRHQTILSQILLPPSPRYIYDKIGGEVSEDLDEDNQMSYDEPLLKESDRQDGITALKLLLKTLMMEQKVRKSNSVMA